MLRRPLVKQALLICTAVAALVSPLPGACADGVAAERQTVTANPAGETGATRVSIAVFVTDVMRVDSVMQTFTANVALALTWRDPRLASSEPAIRRFSYQNVWHPNWLVVNAVGGLDRTFPETVSVTSDGTVTYQQRLIGTFAQAHDLRAFPFDRATFGIHFAAAGHRPGSIEFVPAKTVLAGEVKTNAGIAPQLTLQDWKVTGFATRVLPYAAIPGLEIPGYVVEFQAERYSRHYLLKVILPLILIVMMSWGAFWIDSSMGGMQISVAMSSMLTLIAYRFSVGADVPKVPYLTHLDTFILVSSLLVFFTLVEAIVTTTLVCRQRQALALRIDRYSRLGFPLAFAVVTGATVL